jgi:hypothetical protein
MHPLSYHQNPLEEWVMQTFEELADNGPFGSGRVTLGFAFDLFFLPAEVVKGLFAQVKRKGVKTITCHGSVSLGNLIQDLNSLDLLDGQILLLRCIFSRRRSQWSSGWNARQRKSGD